MAGNPASDSDKAFLSLYDAKELRQAKEILTSWLTFISSGLCPGCNTMISDFIRSIGSAERSVSSSDSPDETPLPVMNLDSKGDSTSVAATHSQAHKAVVAQASSSSVSLGVDVDVEKEDELQEKVTQKKRKKTDDETSPDSCKKRKSSIDGAEYQQFMNMKVFKDKVFFETVNGEQVNILQGLELYTEVFTEEEQKQVADFVDEYREKGKRGELKELTYVPANGRHRLPYDTLHFGCHPGKDFDEPELLIDPLPDLLKSMIKKLVQWHIFPTTNVPNSCTVNLLEKGHRVLPQICNKAMDRPFCMVSFGSDEYQMIFGTVLKVGSTTELEGHVLKFHPRSVIFFSGNAADIAKHSMPKLSKKWTTLIFWKVNESDQPSSYSPEPDLADIKPLPHKPIEPVGSVVGREEPSKIAD